MAFIYTFYTKVDCETCEDKWILTPVTGSQWKALRKKAHTVVKWNTNAQCRQTRASTAKACFYTGMEVGTKVI